MGKHRERNNDYDFDGEIVNAILDDSEMDDDAFFEQFQPKKTRQKTKRARYARRRIEEMKEDRQLAERLDEYYNRYLD
ncbi:MAG: hypothetical protein ACJAYF_000654 [Arenicella sp.]|jgi:hypothetical protein